jgi:predicted amidohydrolase
VKIATWQARLLPPGSTNAVELIRARVDECEREGVRILCCPEAIVGGLADYCDEPARFAISTSRISAAFAPLASDIVTTIAGFTELGADGELYNAAAVLDGGSAVGVYRKRHPAIRRSIYKPGREIPVFHAAGVRFGIVICYDSNFPDLARQMAAQGATALIIPTNNSLPPHKGGAGLAAEARRVDIATAATNRLWVIRSDVAGHAGGFESYGSSWIVDPLGNVKLTAQAFHEELLIMKAADLRVQDPL